MKGVFGFLRRHTRKVEPPLEWMLEVTNRCNLSCPMCLRDKREFLPGDMDHRFIHDLFEHNPPPTALWPYGYGEPLMYPHVFEVIRHAKRKGMVVSLSTNGTYLTETVGRELLSTGLDYLILAFDGATSKTFSKFRKGADFNQVKANADRFIDLKVENKSPLHLTVQMILMRGTAHEVSAFKKLWTRSGVDCVRIREDLMKYRNATKPEETSPPHRPCFFLWRGPLFVQAGGTMIPCPYYHGSKPFADLRSSTVDEAWNSDKMVELRQAHVTGDLSRFPICAACPRHQPNRMLAAASFFIGTRSIRRYLPILETIQTRLGLKLFE